MTAREILRSVFLESIVIGETTFPFSLLRLLTEVVLPVVAMVVGWRLLRRGLEKLIRRSKLSEKTQDATIRWGRRILRIVILLATVLLITRLFGAQLGVYIAKVGSVLSDPFYSSGGTDISIVTLVLLVPVFYASGWAGRAGRRFFDETIANRLTLDPAQRFSMASLFRYALMVLVAVVGLSIIGINLSSLAVVFGVLGIGLGFGLQGVVANVFAGIVIIFTRPIKEGDRILVGETEGTVTQIRLINTVVTTLTNESIVIPNNEIVDHQVHNYTYNDDQIDIRTYVQVSYSSDLEQVEKVLTAVGESSPYRYGTQDVRVLFRSFDDSGITVLLVVRIEHSADRYLAESWAIKAIHQAFADSGISIPFPQLDLHPDKPPHPQLPADAS